MVRVHVPAIILGYKRSLKRQHCNRALVEIIGCKTKEDAQFYLGKRVLYVYKAKSEVRTLVTLFLFLAEFSHPCDQKKTKTKV